MVSHERLKELVARYERCDCDECTELKEVAAELQRRREAMRCRECNGRGWNTTQVGEQEWQVQQDQCEACHGTGDMLEPLPAPPADTVRVRTRDIGPLPPMDLEDEVEGSGR